MVHERATLARRPHLEADLRLLPQHGARNGPDARRDLRARTRPPTRASRSIGGCPPSGAFPTRVNDPDAFAVSANGESERLGRSPATGEDPKTVARHAIEVVRAGFDGQALVEVGIGCEACHGGALEHTRNPGVRPSFAPVAPWLAAIPPSQSLGNSHEVAARLDMQGHARASAFALCVCVCACVCVCVCVCVRECAINRACARCHQVLFSRYPCTWEGGAAATRAGRRAPSTPARRATSCSAAARARWPAPLPRSARARTPRATATRSRRPPATRRARAATPASPRAARSARTRTTTRRARAARASPATCRGRTWALDYRAHALPPHRLADRSRRACSRDRPLECALCHADKRRARWSTRWSAGGTSAYPRQRLRRALRRRFARERWSRDARARQAARAGGRRGGAGRARTSRAAAPLIARSSSNEYPLVREWASAPSVSIVGRCDVDTSADHEAIERAAAAASARTSEPIPPSPSLPRDEEPED